MMKKIAVNLICLFLAVFVLTGCASNALSTFYLIQQIKNSLQSMDYVQQSTQPEREPVCFEDIEYVRPDLDYMYETAYALDNALDNPLAKSEIDQYLTSFFMQCTNFDTMYSVANIRACMDIYDEYYDEEYSWCMEAGAEVDILMDEVCAACADSIHASWIESTYFWDSFIDEYKTDPEMELKGTYEDYFRLVARETELLAQYRDVVSSLSIDVDGVEHDLYEYLAYADDREYAAGLAAYYKKYNSILGDIYIELINVRREQAEFMGYESYAEMQYYVNYGRDYSPEEAEAYLGYVEEHMGGLGLEIAQTDLAAKLMYDEVDEHELELYLETLSEGFGGRIEDAYEFMKQYHMYDFSLSANKAESSFQIYLTDYNAPYLFLCPYGYTDDIMTLCHEFGHYADAYIREDAYESIDLAEMYSQAMQLLGLEQLRCVMTNAEYANFCTMTMLDMLSSFNIQASIAEFELRAHELEQPSVEELNQLYAQLLCDYGIANEYDEFSAMSWIDIPHVFESPFYVISYSVSAAAALELYELELEEQGVGTESFVMMSESMIPGLMEAAEYAGLDEPLSEESVRNASELIRSILLV